MPLMNMFAHNTNIIHNTNSHPAASCEEFFRLKALEIKQSHFINKVLDTKGAVIRYIKPEIVINVKFQHGQHQAESENPLLFWGFVMIKSQRMW